MSCGGKVGDGVRPKDLTATDALGIAAPVCKGAPKYARPLTVDLDTDTRGDLESAMKKSVVIVAYDCVSLRVLANCNVASGSYEYAGWSKKEEVIQMSGMDELKVNLPLGAAKLSGEVRSGRSIDLGLVTVGKRSTTVIKVKRGELTGACEGATHYLQTASIGAFSIATGSVGQVSVVADLFTKSGSAASSSSRKAASSDGSLEACRTSDPDASAPPSECRSPLRVELTPLSEDAVAAPVAKKNEVVAEQNPCREGYKLSRGRCTQEVQDNYLCDPKNEAECKEQCDKGNAGSCTNVGTALMNAYWRVGRDKAYESARPFLKKACDAGDVAGCAAFARASFPWDDADKARRAAVGKELIELNKKSCEAGAGLACFDLATWLSVYPNESFHDETASRKYFERACALGSPNACNTAGMVFIRADPAKGLALYARGCDGGDSFVCNQLAMRFITGMDNIPKDLPRGERLAQKACEMSIEDCGFSAELLAKAGRDEQAFQLAQRGCEGKDLRSDLDDGDKGRAASYRASACKTMGDFHAEGTGTKKDAAQAKSYYKLACDGGDRRACFILKK